ncbi:MAG: DUF4258 domain-containing protein [Planctomycetes bacterium]|nr:DUF4258 domain-containing protein [Planctomycetota bacterium]
MPPRVLLRIRELIRAGQYELTDHAQEEALEDDLHRVDIEAAILNGELARVEQHQWGTRYVIIGLATDLKRPVGVVFQFNPAGRSGMIITVYEVTEKEG